MRLFLTYIDERCQSYLATVEPRLQNLESSNKLVLDKIKNCISTTTFNDFAEKNNTRLDSFEEERHRIKDGLESYVKNLNPRTIQFWQILFQFK